MIDAPNLKLFRDYDPSVLTLSLLLFLNTLFTFCFRFTQYLFWLSDWSYNFLFATTTPMNPEEI